MKIKKRNIVISIIYLLIIIVSLLNIYYIKLNKNIKEENSSSQDFDDIVHNISETTEYADSTRRWFNQISLGISAGIIEDPSAEVSVSFSKGSEPEIKLGKDIRFQLTERTKEDKLIEIIAEEEIYIDSITSPSYVDYFSTSLPGKENVYYMLSAEILDENGKAEDTFVTRIYIPKGDY